MRTPFFSRDPKHKTPFGACKAGENIIFRLILPFDCFGANLIIVPDGREEVTHPLFREENSESDGVWWRAEIALGEPGLYFYYFSFDTPFGHNILTRGARDESIMSPDGRKYQLTCTDAGFKTPDWLSGGIIYQIFPDRFARAQEKINNPYGRFLHGEFCGTPAWRSDQDPPINQDYFGGSLKGIEQKLDYIASLGTTCIYLNPIFEAHSNHRYNTADYSKIDPMLGDEDDFRSLCAAAHKRGIKIMLDGVFSHTGDDSIYFNARGRYPRPGAAQSPDSQYFSWYTFTRYPDKYNAWWGIPTLPEVNESDRGYLDFITGRDGIALKWLRAGADSWRLDVADELPDIFLDRLRAGIKNEFPDAVILGEVWEDASNKESYGSRRRYFGGRQLDSVMNYPFYEAILKFLRGGYARDLNETVMEIVENYPPQVTRLLMNHVGTHDTDRLITALAGEPAAGRSRDWQAKKRLSREQREKGLKFVRLAAVLSFTLPGLPSVYYGDEIGMEGYRDPFNRAPFDWQGGDKDLLEFYRKLGKIRRENIAFDGGEYIPVFAEAGHIAYIRQNGANRVLVCVNRWCDEEFLDLPDGFEGAEITSGRVTDGRVAIPGEGYTILVVK